jgi:Tol biopolymer transport system component
MDSIATDATGPGTFSWDPLDPDRILFFRDSLDEVTSYRLTWLYASRYDGTGLELLTPTYLEYQGTPLTVDGTVDWSPDGQQLVFSGFGALYIINRDGTGLRRLTIGGAASNPETDYDPRFSPDGLQIAFVRRIRYFNGSNTDVWAINADGTNLRQLTNDRFQYTETRVTVDWSPDGTELVVIGLVDPPNDYSAAVYVIPDSSSTDTYLQVRRRVGRPGDIGAINERHPTWRP